MQRSDPHASPPAACAHARTQRGPCTHATPTRAGLIQPELLPDGQVKVDMGEPILEGPKVPTTLQPTQGSTVVEQVNARVLRTMVQHLRVGRAGGALLVMNGCMRMEGWEGWEGDALALTPEQQR